MQCFWVGACIGRDNVGRFIFYLVMETSVVLWTLCLLIGGFSQESSPDAWVASNLALLVAAVVTLGFALFLLSLTGFHAYLVATDQTSWEIMRGREGAVWYLRNVPRGVAAFDKGCVSNVPRVLCPGSRPLAYEMPSDAEMQAMAKQETWFANRFYSCF